MTEKPREEQKVEMNLHMDEQLAKISTMGKYELHSESAGPAMQENNMERYIPHYSCIFVISQVLGRCFVICSKLFCKT